MSHRPTSLAHRLRGRASLVVVAVAAVALVATACGDDPFAIKWSITPDTVLLYSLSRPELGLPSGYNFYNRARVVVEKPGATGSWDVAIGTQNGQIVLLPPGALGVTGKGRVTTLTGIGFDEVTEAPADTTLYVANQAVPVKSGEVYVVRTNQTAGAFGRSCVYYAKLAPVEIDAAAGTFRFVFDSSPVCNDRSLVPKD